MELKFVKYNPAKNMTILVEDQVAPTDYAALANTLMAEHHVAAEQVGYIEMAPDNQYRLAMMGGEFCGNASRCMAVYLVERGLRPLGQWFTIAVSGIDRPVSCVVERQIDDVTYWAAIEMPLPVEVGSLSLGQTGSADYVVFEGITHFIVDAECADRAALIDALGQSEVARNSLAFGVMFYDAKSQFMTPYVFVVQTNSGFWESSCASGTSALAAILALDKGLSEPCKIDQPGGALTVAAEVDNGSLRRILLSGEVSLVARGTAYIR